MSFADLFFSSNSSATSDESRSMPSVSCVRSLDPIEKPSNISANSSACNTLLGISAITYISNDLSFSRSSPAAFITSITFLPSSGVRQNGIITFTLDNPIFSLTRGTARHSSSNPSRYNGL